MKTPTLRSQRCLAHNNRGDPCQRWAIMGGTVCPTHGGSTRQVKQSAEERMRQLVQPAVDSLARQIENDEFPAVKFVLEWAGFRTPVEVKSDSEITIRLVRSEQPIITSVRALEDGA